MKRCTQTGRKNRILAWIISLIMAVTGFSGVSVFADETVEQATIPTETTTVDNVLDESESNDVIEDEISEEQEESSELNLESAAEVNIDNLTVSAVWNGLVKNRSISKSETGDYTVKGKISGIDNITTLKITVDNGTGIAVSADEISWDNQDSLVEGVQFLSDANINVGDVDELGHQLITFSATVNGTGSADLSLNMTTGDNVISKVITIEQIRNLTKVGKDWFTKGSMAGMSVCKTPYKVKYKKKIKYKKNGKWRKKKVTAYKTKYRTLEIREHSGQTTGGYAVPQGACTDGIYSYNALALNGNDYYAKIVKTRLSDNKVVGVSGTLYINHANDITYNGESLVVTHNADPAKDKLKVSVVNPGTLKLEKTIKIQKPERLKGATAEQLQNISNFASVTYMTEGKYAGKYIGVISSYHDFLVMDKDFTPEEYIAISQRYDNEYVYYQGVTEYKGKLLIAVHAKGGVSYSRVCVYNTDGTYEKEIRLKKGDEIENIYHAGSAFYAGYYHKYTKVWYTKKKIKVRYKKHGKWKTKKKKVKVKHSKLIRQGHIYRVSGITVD